MSNGNLEERESEIIGCVPEDPDVEDAIEELDRARRKLQHYQWSGHHEDASLAHAASMAAALALEDIADRAVAEWEEDR